MKVCGVLVISCALCVLKLGNAQNSFVSTSPKVIQAGTTEHFSLSVSGVPSGGEVTVHLLRKNDSAVLVQKKVNVIPNRRVSVTMLVPQIADVGVATLHVFGNFSSGFKMDDGDVIVHVNQPRLIQTDGQFHKPEQKEICEHHVSSTEGVVTSPNFPDPYPQRAKCRWTFECAPGHRIKLIFDEFDLEPHEKCLFDNLNLYDGNSMDAPLLGIFCGSRIPRSVTSTAHTLFMEFHSDRSVQRKGFRVLHSTVCGGQLTAETRPALLYSHANYGNENYDDNTNCTWIVTAANSGKIRVTFQVFDLEQEQDCYYDYLEVLDESKVQLYKGCARKIPPEILSSGNRLFIHFQTDGTITDRGFVLAYSEISD